MARKRTTESWTNFSQPSLCLLWEERNGKEGAWLWAGKRRMQRLLWSFTYICTKVRWCAATLRFLLCFEEHQLEMSSFDGRFSLVFFCRLSCNVFLFFYSKNKSNVRTLRSNTGYYCWMLYFASDPLEVSVALSTVRMWGSCEQN